MIPKICLFALVCALLCALLSGFGYKEKRLFALLCMLLMLISFADSASDFFGGIISLSNQAGIGEAAGCILRVVGLGYVFGFTSEICSSLGEGTIASVVTTIGRVQIFLVAYPYLEKTIQLGVELLG